MLENQKERLQAKLRGIEESISTHRDLKTWTFVRPIDSLIDERVSIEETLAQLEIAEAQVAVARAQRQTAAAQNALAGVQAEVAEVQREATEAQRAATAEAELTRLEAEGTDFWLRRFILSLQIGNGAAFLAVVSSILQAANFEFAARLAFPPALGFGFGVLFAGAIPFAMWFERRQRAEVGDQVSRALSILLCVLSTFAFVVGMGLVQWSLGVRSPLMAG